MNKEHTFLPPSLNLPPNAITLVAWLLFTIAVPHNLWGQTSIREEMRGLTTMNDLQGYYQTIKNDGYRVRYFLKYLPDYLEKTGTTSVPPWIVDLIDQSLEASYSALVREAVVITGKLKLHRFSPKLLTLFESAQTRHAPIAISIRCCIVNSFQQIGGDESREAIQRMLVGYPHYSILNPEFGALLSIAQATGDTTLLATMDRLTRLTSRNMNMISVSRSDEQRNSVLISYRSTLSRIEETRKKIASRTGNPERAND